VKSYFTSDNQLVIKLQSVENNFTIFDLLNFEKFSKPF